jgi:hypothetical protein
MAHLQRYQSPLMEAVRAVALTAVALLVAE